MDSEKEEKKKNSFPHTSVVLRARHSSIFPRRIHSRDTPIQRELSISGPIVVPGPRPIELITALAPSPLLLPISRPVLPPPTYSTGESGSLEGKVSLGEKGEDERASFANGQYKVSTPTLRSE